MENEKKPSETPEELQQVSDETMIFDSKLQETEPVSDESQLNLDQIIAEVEAMDSADLQQEITSSVDLPVETSEQPAGAATESGAAAEEVSQSDDESETQVEITEESVADTGESQNMDFDQILAEASTMCEESESEAESSNEPASPEAVTDPEPEVIYEDVPGASLTQAAENAVSNPADTPAPKKRLTKEIPNKRRPEGKKGYGLLGIPHILVTFVWLALILAIGVSMGRIIWVCAADMLAFGKEEGKVTITIADTDGPDEIAMKLKNAGLVRYPKLFKMFMEIKGAEEEITAGTFTLNTMYDYNALVNSMTPYAEGRQEVEVVIPEGYTCAEIFRLLEAEGVCKASDLEAYAADGELPDYWFLNDVKRGTPYCLEGYLFPDTYKFYTNDDADRVIEKFLDAFEYRFTDTMREWMDALNERLTAEMEDAGRDEAYIQDNLINIHKIITIASMIEKESSGPDESRIISSVIYNRLTDWEYPYLNIDATIIYALGGKDGPLTQSDLQIDSPYNTYTNMGLTPGPIANPGRESIYAALDPMETDYDYYYYALDPETGKHEFFETQSGFEEFLETVDYGE